MSAATIDDITRELRERIGPDSGFGLVAKIDFEGQGVIRIDAQANPNVVDNQDLPADCTIVISVQNLVKLYRGELDPTLAFMQGKMKINGDLAAAMKLGALLKSGKAAGV
jgi:putative sterol carrier protein